MKNFTLPFLMTAAVLSGCVSMQDGETVLDNKTKVVALLNSLESGDAEPISFIDPEKYIQHNLAAGDGLEGFGALLQQLEPGSIKVNVVRAFQDGDYVFAHTEYDFFGPQAGFDIFRFENGLIVEHWDNLSPITAPNPSGRTQFDGTTEIGDRGITEENKGIVHSMVSSILINGEFERLPEFVSTEKYLQHNSAIADGLSGLSAAIEAMAEQGISMEYSKLHMVLGEGNFVLAVSEGSFAGEPVAFYDLFRIENGLIVEHWDVIQTIPPRDQWANTNGKF